MGFCMTIARTRPVFVVASLVMLTSNDAKAYLDPGSTSIIFQALIASILGGLAVLRI